MINPYTLHAERHCYSHRKSDCNRQGANVIRMQLLASAGVPSFVSILPVLCSRALYIASYALLKELSYHASRVYESGQLASVRAENKFPLLPSVPKYLQMLRYSGNQTYPSRAPLLLRDRHMGLDTRLMPHLLVRRRPPQNKRM